MLKYTEWSYLDVDVVDELLKNKTNKQYKNALMVLSNPRRKDRGHIRCKKDKLRKQRKDIFSALIYGNERFKDIVESLRNFDCLY